MSAIDIFATMNGVDIGDMDALQRILIVTDGTVTEILEAVFLERIQLVKVAQQVGPANASHLQLNPEEGDIVMERRILLQGSESGRNYAYAESLIAVNRLGPSFCEKLVTSQVPLGRLWLEHKLETFKELPEVGCRKAGTLSRYFGFSDSSLLLARTYRVFSQGRVVMVITEYFPARYEQPATLVNDSLAGEIVEAAHEGS